MHKIYILKSIKTGKKYVGMTTDVVRRIKEHNSGQVKSTKNEKPYRLLYVERCQSRKAARCREKWYKSGCGREYINNLFSIPR